MTWTGLLIQAHLQTWVVEHFFNWFLQPRFSLHWTLLMWGGHIALQFPQTRAHIQEEAGSIYLYTLEGFRNSIKQPLYNHLNKCLLDQSRKRVEPHGSFLKLLLSALNKVGLTHQPIVFRGVLLKTEEDKQWYTPGRKFSWLAFTSTTTQMNKVQDFIDTQCPHIIFVISRAQGMPPVW